MIINKNIMFEHDTITIVFMNTINKIIIIHMNSVN